MLRADRDFLGGLVESARARVRSGYYDVEPGRGGKRKSLARALREKKTRIPVIAEIKFRSPSEGVLAGKRDAGSVARVYEQGGAAAVSVLTEPDHFDGRLAYLSTVKAVVSIPVLMKDIVVDKIQVEAASRSGADAVLLMAGVFQSGGGDGERLTGMVRYCREMGLEAVVEVHDRKEYDFVMSVDPDVIGINNRNMRDLSVSLQTSEDLLRLGPHKMPIICESGIGSRKEIDSLRSLGADGFLVGSALMKTTDPQSLLKELSRV